MFRSSWRFASIMTLFLVLPVQTANAAEPLVIHITDEAADDVADEFVSFDMDDDRRPSASPDLASWLDLAPGMLGDGFFSRSGSLQGSLSVDRLFVAANDLDAPNPLPAGNQTITITEAGPVGIFSSSVVSIQQIQQLLRAGQPLPPASLEAQVTDSATLTTTMSVSQIQALLASTPDAFDIISIAAPPASYDAGVDAAFQTRNGTGGATNYNAASSGAVLQGAADALTGAEDFDAFYFYDYNVNVNIQNPYAAAVRSGQLKASEGSSPLPRARAYFRYDMFDNVALRPSGETVNRYMPGFERVFHDGMWSVEMRFPFTSTLTGNLTASPTGMFGGSDVQFGDISAFFKVLLRTTDTAALSAGLALSIPTADDIDIRLANGTPLIALQNESVHLGPFLAGLYAPNDHFFAQGFLQFDFDVHGREVLFNSTGSGLTSAGRLTDTSYVFADAGIGYWLTHPTQSVHPTALLAEVHYNGSLNTGDIVQTGNFQVGDGASAVDLLNLTIGASVTLSHNTNLSAGYVTPLASSDEQYDGALRVNLEYRPE